MLLDDTMPQRSCLGCRAKKEKHGLVRLVALNGRLVVDAEKTLPGRGVYLCPRRGCIDAAYKRKGAFPRALRSGVLLPEASVLWEEIRRLIR